MAKTFLNFLLPPILNFSNEIESVSISPLSFHIQSIIELLFLNFSKTKGFEIGDYGLDVGRWIHTMYDL